MFHQCSGAPDRGKKSQKPDTGDPPCIVTTARTRAISRRPALPSRSLFLHIATGRSQRFRREVVALITAGAAVLLSCSGQASADATATVFETLPGVGGIFFVDTETVSAGRAEAENTRTVTSLSGTSTWDASSYASTTSGAIGAAARSIATGRHIGPSASAQGIISEDLTFFGGTRGREIDFTLGVIGDFRSAGPSKMYAVAQLGVDHSKTSKVSFLWVNTPTQPRPFVNTVGNVRVNSQEPGNMSALLTVRYFVQPGRPLNVQASLDVSAEAAFNDVAQANFGHTAVVSFDVPEGWTFTSSSGDFLSAPATLVPEPSSLGLMLAGGLVGAWRWRSTRTVTRPGASA